MNVKSSLIEFISDEILEFDQPVSDDENLLADDMIDSLGMLRLVAYIEATLQVKVPPADFTIANFRTIDAICQYLERNTSAS